MTLTAAFVSVERSQLAKKTPGRGADAISASPAESVCWAIQSMDSIAGAAFDPLWTLAAGDCAELQPDLRQGP